MNTFFSLVFTLTKQDKISLFVFFNQSRAKLNFTITAEILARSLANLYRQYVDMNLKFVRRVSERERAIRPFVIVKNGKRRQVNKLMSVFNESVLLLTMNFVITLSK